MNGFMIAFLIIQGVMLTLLFTVGWFLPNVMKLQRSLGSAALVGLFVTALNALGVTGLWNYVATSYEFAPIGYLEGFMIALVVGGIKMSTMKVEADD